MGRAQALVRRAGGHPNPIPCTLWHDMTALAMPRAVNYHHWGEPKRWYGVPAGAAGAFEAAFREELPEQFERQPDLLFHLVAMLSPAALRRRNVPVYGVLQVRRFRVHPCTSVAPVH